MNHLVHLKNTRWEEQHVHWTIWNGLLEYNGRLAGAKVVKEVEKVFCCDEVRESFDMHSGTNNFFIHRLIYASRPFPQIHVFSMCMYLRRKKNTPIICIIVFGQSTCLETLKFWLNVFLPKARSPSLFLLRGE